MFAFLRGSVAYTNINRVGLDVNGVGFDVQIPDTVQRKLSNNQDVTLLTYCHIREDSFQIFGFIEEEEKALFIECLDINGIGPKVALGILSTLSVTAFAQAIQEHDVTAVTRIPGIGKKLAQRIILEMKNRMGQDPQLNALLGTPDTTATVYESDDVYEALISLGCTAAEAKRAASHARGSLDKNATDEELVRTALRSMAKGNNVKR
ncbi:MAG: Holliday junction branch migration protein RuvA [Candidatus Hydrogenedentes bacterium]|nr:Holliday junction branch migration protein RuvA [Candidatus Hydrogenedentota bacterium]